MVAAVAAARSVQAMAFFGEQYMDEQFPIFHKLWLGRDLVSGPGLQHRLVRLNLLDSSYAF